MIISIIGAAGCVGSTTSFNIAIRALAKEIILIDVNKDLLENHIIDIKDSLVAYNVDTKIISGDLKDITNSDIVIVVAGKSVTSTAMTPGSTSKDKTLHSRQELIFSNISLIKKISKALNEYCPNAVVITGTNPVEALTYSLYLLSSSRNRKKFIGYTLNDSIRFRLYLAQHFRVTSQQVKGIVMGEHGDNIVPIFSSIRINNKPIILSENVKQYIKTKTSERLCYLLKLKAGRTSGWLSGVGLANLVSAIIYNKKQLFPSSAVLNGEYGYHRICMTVPLIVGKGGICNILEYKLTDQELVDLNNSARVIRNSIKYVEESLRSQLECKALYKNNSEIP